MSQSNLTLNNLLFPTTRSTINAMVQAVGTTQKGSAAPTFGTTAAPTGGMMWWDDSVSPQVIRIFATGGNWAPAVYIYASATQAYAKPLPTASNAFTAPQSIVGTLDVTGDVTILATATGSGASPTLTLRRTATATGVLGAINLDGLDSGGANETLARIQVNVIDLTAGSEDGEIDLLTAATGVLASRMKVRQGLQVGSPTGGDKGVGTINTASGVYVNDIALPRVLQVVEAKSATYSLATVNIPYDNTIPQSSEGVQLFSQAFTAKSTSSTLYFDFQVNVCATAAAHAAAALFATDSANAIAAFTADPIDTGGAAGPVNPLTGHFSMTSTATSARTFSLRVGASTTATSNDTLHINGDASAGAGIFGGTMYSYLRITEVLGS